MYEKMESQVKSKGLQETKEGFSPVLKVTITERNLASWSKLVRQRFQERLSKKSPSRFLGEMQKKMTSQNAPQSTIS